MNDVVVDRAAKTATVTMNGADAPSAAALLAALEETKFSAKVRQ